jgi:L-ascorbate metabolism protein UlaG (beta-lactamase superfamily)
VIGRLLRHLLAVLLAAVLLAAAFMVVQFNRRPSLAPYQSLTLPTTPAASGARMPLHVRFAGVTTLVFDDGETVWMTDGFFSRPPALRTLFGRIAPEPETVDQSLRRLGVTRLSAVIPLHAHYDHAMDAPLVAQRTGALLVGGESMLQIGRGAGLAEAQMRVVKAGDTLQLGKFSLRFIPSRHSPTPYSSGHGHEPITEPLTPPAHVTRWREGEVWSLVVTHTSGRRFLVQGSAGIVPGALAGVRADTVFLGTGTLGKKDEAYRAAYWAETVKPTGAKRVIPIHWDDFTLPLTQPLQASPYLIDDFDGVMADLQQRGRQDGIEVRMAPLFEPFVP